MPDWPTDILGLVLGHLWHLHTTSWDQEFRPEAFRRFFIAYALVARAWTIYAQRYVYRVVHLTWDSHMSSFILGVTHPIRGQALQDAIRVLDVTLSHSRLGIPVAKLDKLLKNTPNLVELRLRIGPEVNTLFLKVPQKQRLESAFKALRPTLRALQVSLDERRTKSQIMEHIQHLVDFATLDFVSIMWPGKHVELPANLLDKDKWDVRSSSWARVPWPLETTAIDMPIGLLLAAREKQDASPEEKGNLYVYPSALRVYSYRYEERPVFVDLLGPFLRTVLFQSDFRSARWSKLSDSVARACPNLDRMIILDCHTGGSSIYWNGYPVSIMYVLEPQDWHKGPAITTKNDLDEILNEHEDEKGSQLLEIGGMVETASHYVQFRRRWGQIPVRPFCRRLPVFDERLPSHAFSGIEDTRDTTKLAWDYSWIWAEPVVPVPGNLIVALRQPSTANDDS
ncbi:SubName: Full=Uncharacterized protein {ECO:0000313/EMBL:CCA71834.1} [Serendipita indica DSM 11827]|uniref:Uncharacterized protein n=1 Tax=Serendipita indica (strain DSM 11827) TaxID=1109443 RepID=G4TKI4_SERID|nr:SubName: Full=Uncharacterized protein {ECO:0000313/EMBL:CCA71834.1} [Serendipita indica DSM 11827]CCA71834.1 hypothetical protein PIIN_05769 [Serendipita indica DSM 11827]